MLLHHKWATGHGLDNLAVEYDVSGNTDYVVDSTVSCLRIRTRTRSLAVAHDNLIFVLTTVRIVILTSSTAAATGTATAGGWQYPFLALTN